MGGASKNKKIRRGLTGGISMEDGSSGLWANAIALCPHIKEGKMGKT